VMMQPLGITYLGAILRDDYDVTLLDASILAPDNVWLDPPDFEIRGLSFEDLQAKIRSIAPDILGVSCVFSPQYPLLREIVRRAKDEDPDLVTVAGGTHPTFLAEQVLEENESLDFIVLGEAEQSLPALLEALETGKGLDSIDGLARREAGRIIVQPKTRYIEDLNLLPFPARDLLDMERYKRACTTHGVFQSKKAAASICSSRGCPKRCVYCSSAAYWGRRFRLSSIV